MFIWEFLLPDVLDQLLDWCYTQLVGFLGNFFAQMGNLGIELFELEWVQAVLLFFSCLAWALYAAGLAVSVFEFGIEYQAGRASLRDSVLNALKGFLAAGCFTLAPVELYKLSVTLQAQMSEGLSGYGDFRALGAALTEALEASSLDSLNAGSIFGGLAEDINSPILWLFLLIMMGYAVIKCFFSNLKRGGILLIQIAVGSLYLFSVPRGYLDGFTQWCKQVVGLCLTAFLQTTLLTAGLLALPDSALLGLGLMLSAGEVPRICGAFGLDTSAKASLMSAVHTTQAAVSATRTIVQAVK